MIELKPCPFCGGEAEYDRFANPKNYFNVRCAVCGCKTDGYRLSKSDATDAENMATNAAAWNRRTTPENKPLTLEQLRQMDGEPVWIGEKDKRSHIGQHGLVDIVRERIVFNRGTYTTFKAVAGKTVYPHKPEQEEQNG